MQAVRAWDQSVEAQNSPQFVLIFFPHPEGVERCHPGDPFDNWPHSGICQMFAIPSKHKLYGMTRADGNV